MKLKEQIQNSGLSYKEINKLTGVDKYQLSKYVNYVCMPTPEQAQALCSVLNCKITDIYTKNEMTYKTAPKRLASTNNGKEYYNLHARVDKECCNLLTKDNLHSVGYESINDWVLDCMIDFDCKLIRNQLVDRIEERTGKKYDRARAKR